MACVDAVKQVALFRSAFEAFAVYLCLFEIEMTVHNNKKKVNQLCSCTTVTANKV